MMAETAASDKQIAFIRKLSAERELSAQQQEFLARELDKDYKLSRSRASRIIEGMLKLELKGQQQLVSSPRIALPQVEQGRYAVEDDGVLKFFHVERPTEGKWQGYTFLSVRASDELYPIKAYDHKLRVLSAIAADPRAASERFGREIGDCGVCGRTLTNEESRARGIGPICAAAKGWE